MEHQQFIQFTNVRKAFGKNVVYEDLTVDVRRGEILTIIGGSGTGKSVALKLLIGLLHTDAGDIFVEGQNVVDFSEEQYLPIRRRIAMLFQAGALFDSLSVRDNIAYPLREQTSLTEEEIDARAGEVLALVGLPGIEQQWPASLSGGMRRRVALARAIAVHPEVILYDEPTTGLDPLNVRRISELIIRMRDTLHVTSVVVTHDMQSAFMVSDRIAVVANRRIVACDEAEKIRNSRDPVVASFIHAMEQSQAVDFSGTIP